MREGRARDEDWLGNSRKKIGANNGKGGRECKEEIRNRGGKEQNERRKGEWREGRERVRRKGDCPRYSFLKVGAYATAYRKPIRRSHEVILFVYDIVHIVMTRT